MKPWHLYITNGATKYEELEFEDRKHLIIHYNQVDDFRMYICGREFSKVCTNLPLSSEELMYMFSRIRGPRVADEHNKSCFPVWATHDGVYLDGVCIPGGEWYETQRREHVTE
jgi:hypothetical protein